MDSAGRKPKVLVITGPTGVGKTEMSLLLAKQLGGEIVSADSVQVYRGLDVGSDKLPVEERQGALLWPLPEPTWIHKATTTLCLGVEAQCSQDRQCIAVSPLMQPVGAVCGTADDARSGQVPAGIPHHMIDILDPTDEFSAGEFHDRAHEVTADIIARGNVPIVVGGTGFYLRMFLFGKPQGGTATADDVQKVDQLLAEARAAAAVQEGVQESDVSEDRAWDAAVNVVAQLGDPETAARCCPACHGLTRQPVSVHSKRVLSATKLNVQMFVGLEGSGPQHCMFVRQTDLAEHAVLGWSVTIGTGCGGLWRC